MQELDWSTATPLQQSGQELDWSTAQPLDWSTAQPAQQEQPDLPWYDDVLGTASSTLKGMTQGFSDEVGAVMATGMAYAFDPNSRDKSFSELYSEMDSIIDKRQADFDAANPVVSFTAELAGGLVSGFGIAKGLQMIGKAGTTGMQVGMRTGAIEGGLYGAGTAEGDLGDRATGLLGGAARGGVLGAGLGKGFDMWQNRGSKLLDEVQTKIYSSPVDGQADDSIQRLRDLGYDDKQLVAIQKEMARTGRELDMPTKSPVLEGQTLLANEGAVASTAFPTIKNMLEGIQEGLRRESPEVHDLVNKYEYTIRRETSDRLKEADPFFKGYRALDKPTQQRLSQLLMQGDWDDARLLLKDNEAMLNALNDVDWMLQRTRQRIADSDETFTGIDGYFPRVMLDYKGWRAATGKEQLKDIDAAFQRYVDNKEGITSVDQIPNKVKEEIINAMARGYDLVITKGGKPTFKKQRNREALDFREIGTYYADASQALERYIVRTENDLARRTLFGQSADIGDELMDTNIGNLIRRLKDEGKLENANEDRIVELLKSRFVSGEQTMDDWASFVRDAGNLTTIANVTSAAFQMVDLATPAFLHGIRNTTKGFLQTVTGKGAKLDDVGIDDVIKEELRQDGKSYLSNALNSAFKASAFKLMDRINKETAINASYNKYRAWAKNPEQAQKIVDKYQVSFGNQTKQVIDDLAAGNMTDDVKYILFSELAEMQPITKSAMPLYYNEAKNGRLVYQLKGFMVRQLNLARENLVDKFKTANTAEEYKEAARQALRFALIYGLMGYTGRQTVNLMSGREAFTVEDMPTEALWYLGSMFGVSKYAGSQIGSGDMSGAIKDMLFPPMPYLDVPLELANEAASEDPNYMNAVRNVPVIGNLVYNWLGGGAEAYNERLEQERLKE